MNEHNEDFIENKKNYYRKKLSSRSHSNPGIPLKSDSEKSLFTRQKTREKSLKVKTDFLSVKMDLHQRLLAFMDKRGLLGVTEDETIKNAVQNFMLIVMEEENLPINESERSRIVDELTEETLGIGPLATLMADPAVTDILVNNPYEIYVERFGRLEKTSIQFQDNDHLTRMIQRIVSSIGRRIDEQSPYVDARLPDGSRVNATLPPVTVDGPTLSIRRFGRNRITPDDLLKLGSISQEMVQALSKAIEGRTNVVISGGTGAGKSTLLSSLVKYVPAQERLITIEDTVELFLNQPHVIRCETRPSNIEGQGEITARDLIRNALRMRPDRIIVGEVRGPEAFDMLQAMNSGHEGSMTTLHANSPRDALSRLENMVLMAGTDLPSRAIRDQFVSAIDLIIHIERSEDGVRRVTSVVEVVGMESDVIQTHEIFRFERQGKTRGVVNGVYTATGIIPRFVEQVKMRGLEMPLNIFQKGF